MDKLIWIAKRLADIAEEIEGLDEEEKRYVIEKAEKLDINSLIELYNSLGDYGRL